MARQQILIFLGYTELYLSHELAKALILDLPDQHFLTCLFLDLLIYVYFILGMDISPLDLINIESFASKVIGLADYRKKLHSYLISKMDQVAPNLSDVIGELVSDS